MTEMKGSCLCGSVTYQILAEPLTARVCWCKDCQKIASNGTVNAVVNSEFLKVEGNLSDFKRVAGSGNEVNRRFCPQCGSHLFANSSAFPNFTVVRIGTLENPSSISPSVNIWSKSAPVWACMNPDIGKIDGQPVPPQQNSD
jgi:hypothetical protein